MPNNARPPRTASAAQIVRARVQRGGERFWHQSDFEGLPPSAVATALSRMARDGTLERVAKGVYYRPQLTSFGPSIAGASAVAAQTLKTILHPTGLSAANLLGLSIQNPMSPEYAITASGRPSALTSAIVHTRRPEQRAGLSAQDGAILETLRDRARHSDVSPKQTVAQLMRLLAENGRFERLAHAATSEPPRVRAMLGAFGQELGAPNRELQKLRASLNPLSRYDFGKLRTLRHAKEWQAK